MEKRRNAVVATATATATAAATTTRAPIDLRPLLGETFLTPKRLLPDQEPLLGHLSNASLAVMAGKASIMTLTARTNFINRKVEEMEKKNEFPDDLDMADVFSPTRRTHELNLWNGFASHAAFLFARDFCITSVLRVYEHAVAYYAPYRAARSLIKAPSLSALRKIGRGMSRPVAAAKMLPSALKSQALYWSALFTVTLVTELANVWRDAKRRPHARPSASSSSSYSTTAALASIDVSDVLHRSYRILVRCGVAWVLAGVGASLGTLARPGIGTTLGAVIFPNLAMAIVG